MRLLAECGACTCMAAMCTRFRVVIAWATHGCMHMCMRFHAQPALGMSTSEVSQSVCYRTSETKHLKPTGHTFLKHTTRPGGN